MERRAAVFSIKPHLIEAIISGDKRFEFRRVRPALEYGDTVFMYSTSPEMAIVGEFTCGRILEGSPTSLWRKLGKDSGTSRAGLLDYFSDKDTGFAIEIEKPLVWSHPLNLASIREGAPGFHPPQSYRFLSPQDRLTRIIGAHESNGAANRKSKRNVR